MKDTEIERKFLLDINNIPYDFSKLTKKTIEQGYIIYKPEIRVRSVSGEDYFMTIKANTADPTVRKELEFKISEEAYSKLMARKDIQKVQKDRYLVNEGNNKYEIDIFTGDLKGLACLEVEFSSKEEADKFVAPNWVVKEVTGDERYRNNSLAKNNLPLEFTRRY